MTLALQVYGGLAAWATVLMVWERVAPAVALPRTRAWYPRALANLAGTMLVAQVGEHTWIAWVRAHAGGGLFHVEPAPLQALLAYGLGTLAFYVWHRARHEVRALWDTLHQMHHAPARVETLTATYVHPLEGIPSALLNAAIVYGLLGGGHAGFLGSVALFTAVGLFYHANVRTPAWLDAWIATPELHRLHHRAGVHAGNYSDLPVWDRLFGTWVPRTAAPETFPMGFRDGLEERFLDILRFRNVLARHAPPARGGVSPDGVTLQA